MKKSSFRSFLSGVVVTLLIVCLFGTAMAKTGSQSGTLTFRDIKVTLDGSRIALTDATGAAVEPFIIDGTTYLPVRAVATALGLTVGWDNATNTVVLTSPGKTPTQPTTLTQTGEPTMGQKNALAKAKSYLNYSAFSYKGLIEQLEYEKFSTADATYAVDNCGADWFEQAAKKAKSYLSFTSFSRDGLIEQLEYEGFTHEQAVYGVEQNGY